MSEQKEPRQETREQEKSDMDVVIAAALHVRKLHGAGVCYDTHLRRRVFLETPFGLPRAAGHLTSAEKFVTPGCRLKSVQKDTRGQWPVYFGILCVHDSAHDVAVVLGVVDHGVDSGHWVWVGTTSEYARTWEGD